MNREESDRIEAQQRKARQHADLTEDKALSRLTGERAERVAREQQARRAANPEAQWLHQSALLADAQRTEIRRMVAWRRNSNREQCPVESTVTINGRPTGVRHRCALWTGHGGAHYLDPDEMAGQVLSPTDGTEQPEQAQRPGEANVVPLEPLHACTCGQQYRTMEEANACYLNHETEPCPLEGCPVPMPHTHGTGAAEEPPAVTRHSGGMRPDEPMRYQQCSAERDYRADPRAAVIPVRCMKQQGHSGAHHDEIGHGASKQSIDWTSCPLCGESDPDKATACPESWHFRYRDTASQHVNIQDMGQAISRNETPMQKTVKTQGEITGQGRANTAEIIQALSAHVPSSAFPSVEQHSATDQRDDTYWKITWSHEQRDH